MTRMSTQISKAAAIVLGIFLVLGLACTQLSAQLLPSKLTNEIIPQAKANTTVPDSSDAASKVEGITVQLPELSTTTVNTVISVPDGGLVQHGSKRIDPQTVQVPDGGQTGMLMTVTPRIIIQEEEEAPLIGPIGGANQNQCPKCPGKCDNSCPNCPAAASATAKPTTPLQSGQTGCPIVQAAKATTTVSDSSDPASEVEGITIQLPTFAITDVNTVVSVPDGGSYNNGSKRMDPQTVQVPDAEHPGMLSIVTPRIIIQEEEEPLIGIIGNANPNQCAQCPGNCENSCPNCPAALATAQPTTPIQTGRPVCTTAQAARAAQANQAAKTACPFGDECQGQCATEMPDSGYARLRLPAAPTSPCQCGDSQCSECEKDLCTELATTLSESLADSNIHPQS